MTHLLELKLRAVAPSDIGEGDAWLGLRSVVRVRVGVTVTDQCTANPNLHPPSG